MNKLNGWEIAGSKSLGDLHGQMETWTLPGWSSAGWLSVFITVILSSKSNKIENCLKIEDWKKKVWDIMKNGKTVCELSDWRRSESNYFFLKMPHFLVNLKETWNISHISKLQRWPSAFRGRLCNITDHFPNLPRNHDIGRNVPWKLLAYICNTSTFFLCYKTVMEEGLQLSNLFFNVAENWMWKPSI